MYYPMTREVEYNGIVYKVLEDLTSDYLLVVEKEDLDKKRFPITPVIIPSN